MGSAIDWEQLAEQLGTLKADGESGGSDVAKRAIELLLGEQQLRDAVDHYVAGGRGSELTRSVLWQLQPWSAMKRCYEIYQSDADIESKVSAVELLRVVADRRALEWVAEFLADTHPGIQNWGAGILDQLLWSGLVQPEDCEDLLIAVRKHSNGQVQKTAVFIDEYLRGRAEASA
jgi:hypothetical protein